MELVLQVILLSIIAGATAYIAQTRGRSPVAWFTLGILFSFMALLVLLLLPDLNRQAPPEVEGSETVEGGVTQVPPPPPVQARWYYLDADRTQHGPLDRVALHALWQTGSVRADTLVWTEGMAEWQALSEQSELQEMLDNST
jgi:hypothetical protein